MISKENAYKQALEIKKNTLNEKRLRHNTLLNGAYASNPHLHDIDLALSQIGSKIAICAISGGSESVEALREKSAVLSAQKKDILSKLNIGDIEYDCPLCEDTGYIGGKICGCVKEIAKSIITKDLCAVMPINECRFDNFELEYYAGDDSEKRMSAILNMCKEYAENFSVQSSPNLLFMGASGLGKTHLSLAIAGEVVKKGYLPVYGPCENLLSAIEKEKFSGFDNNSDSYKTMSTCDLLIIDDLGTEFNTALSRSILYNLINSRILNGKPTIISTNLSLSEIDEMYSSRIASRLIGSYTVKEFLGKDIRKQKALKG